MQLTETVEDESFDGDGDIDLAFAGSNIVAVMPEGDVPDFSISRTTTTSPRHWKN